MLDLVENAPQMLPLAGSPQLTMLGREVRLGSGCADSLAVQSTGRLVLIEVKLAGKAESRRFCPMPVTCRAWTPSIQTP